MLTGRRGFLRALAGGAAAAGGAAVAGCAGSHPLREPPPAREHELTVVAGTARERGREYGGRFCGAIRSFLDREIYRAFEGKPGTREEMRRYAGACAGEVRAYSPEIHQELEGMAEGSGLELEELVLITLHEELWHRGVIPSHPHCTAVAAGPPDTRDGATYVAQTWDWMGSVYGLSSMLLWRRREGPSLLAYAYPGLWVGAGLNSAGLALTWTSGLGDKTPGPRVGIPSYVLIAQMLYQETLDAALAEARRARHAGWFTFVLGDGDGRLLNVEGRPSPRGDDRGDLAVESARGHFARVSYGTRALTGTPEGKPVERHPRAAHMDRLLDGSRGMIDRGVVQGFLGDHGDAARAGSAVCLHGATLDAMVFDTTRREAHLTRGPGCSGRWRRFGLEPA